MALENDKVGQFALESIEKLGVEFPADCNPRIEHMMIVLGVSIDADPDDPDPETDENGERREQTVFVHTSTNDPIIQMGLTRAATITAENGWAT